MNKQSEYQLSQLLSLILRHNPEKYNVNLDDYGYAYIDEIVNSLKLTGIDISSTDIRNVVIKSDKQRFKIVENKIKANQGHSIEVKLEEKSQIPPNILYHGTKLKLKDIIFKQGLLRMERNFVHTYKDYYRSFITGNRTTTLSIVLEINAKQMYDDGYEFYKSDNDVWQTKFVPSKYFTIKELDEIDILKTVKITKETYFTKLIESEFKLDSNFNSSPWIYVHDCYICKSEKSIYSFGRNILICKELTYEGQKKNHSLLGENISFEQSQTNNEIFLKSTFEVKIKGENNLQIIEDTSCQSIGLRLNCPICDELDFVSNFQNVGDIFKCRKCDTKLLRIDEPTKILQVTRVLQ